MSASTEPRSGIKYGWSLGESGWNTEMDADLLLIGRVGFHLSVKDRSLTTPPGSPAAGETYIPAATATGAWAGNENNIAVWSGTAWVFYVARTGYQAFIENEEVIATFKSSAWSNGHRTSDRAAVSMTSDASKTVSAVEGAAAVLDVSSTISLTATRNVVVPLTPRQFTVYNGTTGAQSLQFIGASGTGITVANGKHAILRSNGTNILRVTADT